MIEPLAYHIEFCYDPNIFNRSSFVKDFRSNWIKEWNYYNQQRIEKKQSILPIPEYHYIFSFEYKKDKPAGTNGNKGKIILNYHHCHFYFIVDNCHHKYGIDMLVNRSINTFKKINGINTGKNYAGQQMNPALQYRKDGRFISNDYTEFRYHNLKDEFNDAFKRISYISKVDQKQGVPFPNTFDSSIRSVKKCNSINKD